MSALTESEIMALLDTMDPSEILEEKKDRLDQAGRKLLAELQQDLESGHEMFEEFGRKFREADNMERKEAEKKQQHLTTKVEKPIVPFKRRTINVPQWALAAAAIFASVAILPNLIDWGVENRVRGRTVNMESILSVNEKLALALLERGQFLYDVANQNEKKEHLEEARVDLLQAYDLDPQNIELLSLLARVHERLGMDQDSDRYFKEWKAAKAFGEKEGAPE